MKISYEYTEKDYKKYLLKSRRVNNIILFIIALIIYLYFNLNKLNILNLLIFILILVVALFLLNRLYVVAQLKVNNMLNNNVIGKYIIELTPNKYSVTINKHKIDYKYKDIKKIKVNKNSFTLKLNKFREYLIFEKEYIKEEDYNKMIDMFKKKINI